MSRRHQAVDERHRRVGPVDSHTPRFEVVGFAARPGADLKHRPTRCSRYQLVKKNSDVSIDGLRRAIKVGVHLRLVGGERPLGRAFHRAIVPRRSAREATSMSTSTSCRALSERGPIRGEIDEEALRSHGHWRSSRGRRDASVGGDTGFRRDADVCQRVRRDRAGCPRPEQLWGSVMIDRDGAEHVVSVHMTSGSEYVVYKTRAAGASRWTSSTGGRVSYFGNSDASWASPHKIPASAIGSRVGSYSHLESFAVYNGRIALATTVLTQTASSLRIVLDIAQRSASGAWTAATRVPHSSDESDTAALAVNAASGTCTPRGHKAAVTARAPAPASIARSSSAASGPGSKRSPTRSTTSRPR